MTNEIDISKYLTEKYQKGRNNYGNCIHCKKNVEWRSIKNCEKAPPEFKERIRGIKENFKKRKAVSYISQNSTADSSYSNFSSEPIFPEDSISTSYRPSKIKEHFRVITEDFIERVDMKV
jgi:hypothetical protein